MKKRFSLMVQAAGTDCSVRTRMDLSRAAGLVGCRAAIRVAILASLTPLAVSLAGCGEARVVRVGSRGGALPQPARAGSPPSTNVVRPPFKPAKVIYTAGGKLGAGLVGTLAVQPGTHQGYLLAQEITSAYKVETPRRERLVRLDLSSGKAQTLAEFPAEKFSPRPLAYARSGRVAMQELRGYVSYRITVREPDGHWRAVTDWGDAYQTPLAWSPDSASLLIASLFTRRSREARGREAILVGTARAAGDPFVVKELPEESLVDALWSADGSQIYCRTLGFADALLAFNWPSLRETSLSAHTGVDDLSVAEETGDVVFLSRSGDGSVVPWRMKPGSKLEITRVKLSSWWPAEAVVSPDGRYLAVALGKPGVVPVVGEGGLVVYGLDDGSQRTVPGLVGKNVMRVQWALSGRALAFTIAQHGQLEWEGAGKQVWLAQVR